LGGDLKTIIFRFPINFFDQILYQPKNTK